MLTASSHTRLMIRLVIVAVSLRTLLHANDAQRFLVDTWKHRFSAECMSVVHDQAFGAKSPSYQTILQLDRKLRAFAVPPVLQVAGFGSSEPGSSVVTDTLELIMQRHIVLALREMSK